MSSPERHAIEIHRLIHVGQKLGEGAMGLVLDAFAADLGQHLAVKKLRPELMDDPEARERFEEEVAIMATISHPGVLPVYGLGRDENHQLFYAMKKVEGKTLKDIMADPCEPKASLPRRNRLLRILLDVCEAVASAHDKGIVHRDLKPENILVDPEESVYVIDWGIAKHRESDAESSHTERTLAGKIMGTPGYMSPEQAEGSSSRAGAQADVFTLGAILYEIVSGIRPFAAANARAEMLGTIHQDPPHLKRFNFLLPRSLCALCHKALQKNPADRYPTARGLADDLRAYLEGRPVKAVRPNLIERLTYASRQRPLQSLVVSSILTAIVAASAFIGVQRFIDHRLAEKSLARLAVIDSELDELLDEERQLSTRLMSPGIEEAERQRLIHELGVLDFRWILGQFEGYLVLRGVTELRFIKTDPDIEALVPSRRLEAIEASIARNRPAFAEAIIGTLLERNEDGRLSKPLSPDELLLLRRLADKAADLSGRQEK